jgi:hypothetical protein
MCNGLLNSSDNILMTPWGIKINDWGTTQQKNCLVLECYTLIRTMLVYTLLFMGPQIRSLDDSCDL